MKDGRQECWERKVRRQGFDHLYRVKKKGYKRAAKELEQQIKAKAATLQQYENRVKQYRQNSLFQSYQSKFYQEFDGKSREENTILDEEKTRQFWSGIWEKDVKHNEKADWIQGGMQYSKQQNFEVTPTKIKERTGKMTNWKALGPDGVHGYWHHDACVNAGKNSISSTKLHNLRRSIRLDGNWSDCPTTERQEQRKRS